MSQRVVGAWGSSAVVLKKWMDTLVRKELSGGKVAVSIACFDTGYDKDKGRFYAIVVVDTKVLEDLFLESME